MRFATFGRVTPSVARSSRMSRANLGFAVAMRGGAGGATGGFGGCTWSVADCLGAGWECAGLAAARRFATDDVGWDDCDDGSDDPGANTCAARCTTCRYNRASEAKKPCMPCLFYRASRRKISSKWSVHLLLAREYNRPKLLWSRRECCRATSDIVLCVRRM